ncbi:MAG: hypothetical protein ACLT8E_00850 [Akkermansia sp.]
MLMDLAAVRQGDSLHVPRLSGDGWVRSRKGWTEWVHGAEAAARRGPEEGGKGAWRRVVSAVP